MEYAIVFSGKLQQGAFPSDVKPAVAGLLRISETEEIDGYFSGQKCVLKSGMSQEEAARCARALRLVGAVVEVVPVGAGSPESPGSPTGPKPPTIVPIPAAINPESVSVLAQKTWAHLRKDTTLGTYTRAQLIGLACVGELKEGDKLLQTGYTMAFDPRMLDWLSPALAAAKVLVPPTAAEKQVQSLMVRDQQEQLARKPAPPVRSEYGSAEMLGRLLWGWYLLMPGVLYFVNGRMSNYEISATGRHFYLCMLYVLPGLIVWWQDFRGNADSSADKLKYMSGSVVAALIAAGLATQGITIGRFSAFSTSSVPATGGSIQATVDALNQSAPKQLDLDVRFDSARYDGNVLHNKLTLTRIDAASADKLSLTRYAWARVGKSSCWSSHIAAAMREGVLTITYDFYDRAGVFVVSAPVTFNACTSPQAPPTSLTRSATEPPASAATPDASGLSLATAAGATSGSMPEAASPAMSKQDDARGNSGN